MEAACRFSSTTILKFCDVPFTYTRARLEPKTDQVTKIKQTEQNVFLLIVIIDTLATKQSCPITKDVLKATNCHMKGYRKQLVSTLRRRFSHTISGGS
jgi:hypothetical protein